MEIFRRLGVAKKVREARLPADYPNDIGRTMSWFMLTRPVIPLILEIIE